MTNSFWYLPKFVWPDWCGQMSWFRLNEKQRTVLYSSLLNFVCFMCLNDHFNKIKYNEVNEETLNN